MNDTVDWEAEIRAYLGADETPSEEDGWYTLQRMVEIMNASGAGHVTLGMIRARMYKGRRDGSVEYRKVGQGGLGYFRIKRKVNIVFPNVRGTSSVNDVDRGTSVSSSPLRPGVDE